MSKKIFLSLLLLVIIGVLAYSFVFKTKTTISEVPFIQRDAQGEFVINDTFFPQQIADYNYMSSSIESSSENHVVVGWKYKLSSEPFTEITGSLWFYNEETRDPMLQDIIYEETNGQISYRENELILMDGVNFLWFSGNNYAVVVHNKSNKPIITDETPFLNYFLNVFPYNEKLTLSLI